jgi:hypothetical protein
MSFSTLVTTQSTESNTSTIRPKRWRPPSLFIPSPFVSLSLSPPASPMSGEFPPTPSPSLPSHSQRNSTFSDYPQHPYLPPTPPQITYAMESTVRSHHHRHASINVPEGRAESYMTNDSSSSGGPNSPAIGVAYGGDDKAGQRARTRITTGRTNAYSSAESSTASGFYTVNTYPSNTVQHPHPPPLPTQTEVGLGFSPDDAPPARPVRTSSYNAGRSILHRQMSNHSRPATQTSPSNTQPPSAPWQDSIANRMRSDSASSSTSAASYSDRQGDTSASESDIDGRPGRYPWEGEEDTEDEEPAEAVAISLVEKGRERILDENRIRSMGGLEVVVNEKLNELIGEFQN